jgi:uncharacterized protein with HEPN domain
VSKDPRVYLAQILERIERIEDFTRTGRESFFRELLIQDAVIRNFEVIGEAAKRVPKGFREQHPEIPWRDLAAFRDVLIHQYEGVSLEAVWSTIAHNLPEVRRSLEALLPPLDELERELGGDQ